MLPHFYFFERTFHNFLSIPISTICFVSLFPIYISYLPTNTNFVWMNEPNNKENKNFANVNLSIDRAP